MEKKSDRVMAMAVAAGLGAGLAYLLDARNGRRRRAQLRDRGIHMLRKAEKSSRREAAHLASHGIGLAMKFRQALKARIFGSLGILKTAVDDSTLRDRVRSIIGHRLSHTHALQVETRDGMVTLRGPIPSGEMAGLLNQVRGIPGVRGVTPRLEPKDHWPDSRPGFKSEAGPIPAPGATPAR